MKKAFYTIIDVIDILLCVIYDIIYPIIEFVDEFNGYETEEKVLMVALPTLLATGLIFFLLA